MSFTGKWNIVMKTPMGDRAAVLNMVQDGDALSGTMEADDNTIAVDNGKVEDGRAKWDADLTQPMPITLKFDVEKNGDNLDGTVKLGMFGSSSVSGTPA